MRPSRYQSCPLARRKIEEPQSYCIFYSSSRTNLPLLDRMYKEMVNPSEKLRDLRNKVKDAEGYLSVTPEYNHSTSAAMKNTLDYF